MYLDNSAGDLAKWRQLVSQHFVPLDTSTELRERFTAKISGQRFAEVSMLLVSAQQQRVERTQEQIDASSRSNYKLILQLYGEGNLTQHGRDARLGPGDLALIETDAPYILEFDQKFNVLVLMFPKSALGLRSSELTPLLAERLIASERMAGAISPFMTALAEQLPTLNTPLGHRLVQNLLDLLETFFADEIYQGHGIQDEHSKQLSTIYTYIDNHLQDIELTPSSIAAAHFISVRTLHKLFSSTGVTVSEWIRKRRLERCRQDLSDPLSHDLPVGAIGARWGLMDAAHFSRSFRSEYGLSPSAYRASTVKLIA